MLNLTRIFLPVLLILEIFLVRLFVCYIEILRLEFPFCFCKQINLHGVILTLILQNLQVLWDLWINLWPTRERSHQTQWFQVILNLDSSTHLLVFTQTRTLLMHIKRMPGLLMCCDICLVLLLNEREFW